jgi:hypothetical protein
MLSLHGKERALIDYSAASNRKRRESMSKTGNTRENLVTGYRAVVRVGTKDSGGEPLVTDLYLRLDRAVTGEHVHPAIEEWCAGTRAGRLPHRQARVAHGAGPTLARAGPGGTRLVERRRGGVHYSREQSWREVRGDDRQPPRPGTGWQDETQRGCSTSCRPRSSPGSSVTCCTSPSLHWLCSDC